MRKSASHSKLVLAFDIGTSSMRSALFQADGSRIAETTAQQTYRLDYTPDGGAEFSPIVLRRAARRVISETLSVYRKDPALRAVPIVALGTSCFWHSVIGVDAKNRPLTPIYTWADSRCRADAEALRKVLDEREVHARTGCMLRSSFWPAKLTWIRRTQCSVWKSVKRWMSPAEWLYVEFAGEANCGFAMASGTGMFNAHTLTWDPEMLEQCGITEQSMNPLGEASTGVIRSLRDFPELRGAPWFPAIGDGVASNLGCGATHAGLAAINMGTSGALRVMRTGGVARAPFGLFCYRVDDHRYLVGGAISNAGNLRAWCLRELRLDDDPAAIERALARRPAPNHGLTVLPFWTAERAPTWEEEKRGVIAGLTQNTTALDILQAVTEATYQRIALIGEMVLKEETTTPKFIVSGGIRRSHSSMQRLADVLNLPLYTNDEPEASIRGACIYVLHKLGFQVPPFKFSRPVRPRKRFAEIYAAEREKQARLEGVV